MSATPPPPNNTQEGDDPNPLHSHAPSSLLVSPDTDTDIGVDGSALAVPPPESTSHHHEAILISAAQQVLHSVRGAGATIATLASAIANPAMGTADGSASSSDESDSDDRDEAVRSPTMEEAFSSDVSTSDDDDDYDSTRRRRRSLPGVSDFGSRHRLPSYAHHFPKPNLAETPIEGYGLIGNCHTTALISNEATIAWYCFPHHDSPSIFHSLIDPVNGGSFRITAGREIDRSSVTTKQLYHTETNVLLTRFFTNSGVGHVTDYMCMGDLASKIDGKHWLVRELEVVRGRMYFNVECTPAFNYGMNSHRVSMLPHGALFQSDKLSMLLTSSKARVWKPTASGGGIRTRVTLEEGQRVVFVLREYDESVERAKWSAEQREKALTNRQVAFLQGQLEKIVTEANTPIMAGAVGSSTPGHMSGLNTPRLALDILSPLQPPLGVGLQPSLLCLSPPPQNEAPSPITPNDTITPSPQPTQTSTTTSDAVQSAKEECFGLHTIRPIARRITNKLRRQTMDYWRSWVATCPYEGRWREIMRRSALVLKLLTFKSTGAIIQAPTCGLPVQVGGPAGPDARFVHLRDASLAASAFLRLGFREEASAFMAWLADRCEENQQPDGSLQHVYTIHGESSFQQVELPHLPGYKRSGPIQVGSSGANRYCLDVYGSLLISIYLSNLHAEPISYEFWRYTRKLIDFVCSHWRDADDGLYDSPVRRHFTTSKMMCWICVDRGIKLAHERSLPAPFNTWKRTRDEIYSEVQEKGFDKKQNVFVQAYDSTLLDAALLLMPVAGFIAPTDPKFLSTLDAITRSVNADGLTSNSLIHRSNETQCTTNQVTSTNFTFWAIEACTRAGLSDKRYLDRARLLMEQMRQNQRAE